MKKIKYKSMEEILKEIIIPMIVDHCVEEALKEMGIPIVKRRTFEARKYPKGSPERIKLNENPLTSEYMTSYKYLLIGKNFTKSFVIKKEAYDDAKIYINNVLDSH
jgi:hypothetical protein